MQESRTSPRILIASLTMLGLVLALGAFVMTREPVLKQERVEKVVDAGRFQ